MKSRNVTGITSIFVLGAMLAGSLFAAPARQAEASRLLKEVQSRAGVLAREAAVLDSYTRGGLSKESHVDRLNQVKEHINAIGVRLQILQAIRADVAPWQQVAIDAVVPVAANLAAHTEAAILHLSESGKPLWHQDYTSHVRAISDRSDRVKETIDLHLEMASTGDKLERLRDRANDLEN